MQTIHMKLQNISEDSQEMPQSQSFMFSKRNNKTFFLMSYAVEMINTQSVNSNSL